jgi:hypothetical protein
MRLASIFAVVIFAGCDGELALQGIQTVGAGA